MRQLNKENEDLQLRVEELAQSLYTVQAGKQAVKAAFEVGASNPDAALACAKNTLIWHDCYLFCEKRTLFGYYNLFLWCFICGVRAGRDIDDFFI